MGICIVVVVAMFVAYSGEAISPPRPGWPGGPAMKSNGENKPWLVSSIVLYARGREYGSRLRGIRVHSGRGRLHLLQCANDTLESPHQFRFFVQNEELFVHS